MDFLEKNYKHHVAVGVAAVVLGLVSEKLLKHKTINTSSVGDGVFSFVTVSLASMGADYAMSMTKKPDHS